MQRRKAGWPFTIRWCLSRAYGVACALADLHTAGVVHEEVKASNVVVTEETGNYRFKVGW